MTKEQLAAMSVETLEVIANGLPKPAESQPGVVQFANYGGQAFPASIHANAAEDDLVKAVAPVDLPAHFQKKAAQPMAKAATTVLLKGRASPSRGRCQRRHHAGRSHRADEHCQIPQACHRGRC